LLKAVLAFEDTQTNRRFVQMCAFFSNALHACVPLLEVAFVNFSLNEYDD